MKKFICLVKNFDGGYPFGITIKAANLSDAEDYCFSNFETISIREFDSLVD